MIATEDHAHASLRVKLFKKGYNQDQITHLFETYTIEELQEYPKQAKKIVDKAISILNDAVNGNKNTFGFVKQFVRVMVENDEKGIPETTVFLIASKNNGKWSGNMNILPFSIESFNIDRSTATVNIEKPSEDLINQLKLLLEKLESGQLSQTSQETEQESEQEE